MDHDYDDDNGNDPAGTPPGTSNPHGDTGASSGTVTPPANDPKEHTRQCPPTPRKPIEEEEAIDIDGHTKVSRAVTSTAKEYESSTKSRRYDSGYHSHSRAYVEMLAEFLSPEPLKYRPPSLVYFWPISDDCPDNYEHGKLMVTLGQLVQDEPWEVWRFHL